MEMSREKRVDPLQDSSPFASRRVARYSCRWLSQSLGGRQAMAGAEADGDGSIGASSALRRQSMCEGSADNSDKLKI